MKKLLAAVLAVMMLVTAMSFVSAAPTVSVLVNGQKLNFEVDPQIIDGNTMVPLRAIFEALGAKVDWDDATKTVYSEKGTTKISLTIGVKEITVDGTKKALEVAPIIIAGNTLVPVRAISEAYACTVGWIDATKTVTIDMPNDTPAVPEIPGAVIANADAEDGGKVYLFNFGSTESTIEIIPDSDDPSNHVYSVKWNKPETKGLTYLTMKNIKFEPNQRYIVEFDVRATSDVYGDPLEANSTVGTNFAYTTTDDATTVPVHHDPGGMSVPGDGSWAHYTCIYTMPANLAVENSMWFGIYGTYTKKEGFSDKVNTNFEYDNISILPYDGTDDDGVVK